MHGSSREIDTWAVIVDDFYQSAAQIVHDRCLNSVNFEANPCGVHAVEVRYDSRVGVFNFQFLVIIEVSV